MPQFFRNAVRFPIRLMPNWAVGFEQALIRDQVFQVQRFIQAGIALGNKLDELLQHDIQGFVARRDRFSMWHAPPAQHSQHFPMGSQPAPLPFESMDVSKLHHHKEHQETAFRVRQRPTPLPLALLSRLLKSPKQCHDQPHIVGQSGLVHWTPPRWFAHFRGKPLWPSMSNWIYAHPSVK